jgi:hypothetical protein
MRLTKTRSASARYGTLVLTVMALTGSAGCYLNFQREQQTDQAMATANLSVAQAVDKAFAAVGG